MSLKKCPECSSSEFSEHNGDLYCTHCAILVSSGTLTTTFQSVPGVHKSGGNAAQRNWLALQCSESTKERYKREIDNIAANMKLSPSIAASANRTYDYLQGRGYTKGRKSRVVMIAAIYIACRLQEVPMLLVDFEDSSGIDAFTIGKCFIDIMRKMRQQKDPLFTCVKLIDPSLFIRKFCNKLSLGDKQLEVTKTANKVFQRMDRDWMSAGRRPAGLCGAAIALACKIHSVEVDVNRILGVVKIGGCTLRRRLEEFKRLPIAAITAEDFDTKWTSEKFDVYDPPCFVEAAEGLETAGALERIPSILYKESVSDVDDEEIENVILTPEESQLKELIWTSVNAEWLEQQRLKQENNRQAKGQQ